MPNRSILSILGQLGCRLSAFARNSFVRFAFRFVGVGGDIAIGLAIALSFVESTIVISYSKIDIVGCWTAPLGGRRGGGCRTSAGEELTRGAAGDGSARLSVVIRLA